MFELQFRLRLWSSAAVLPQPAGPQTLRDYPFFCRFCKDQRNVEEMRYGPSSAALGGETANEKLVDFEERL